MDRISSSFAPTLALTRRKRFSRKCRKLYLLENLKSDSYKQCLLDSRFTHITPAQSLLGKLRGMEENRLDETGSTQFLWRKNWLAHHSSSMMSKLSFPNTRDRDMGFTGRPENVVLVEIYPGHLFFLLPILSFLLRQLPRHLPPTPYISETHLLTSIIEPEPAPESHAQVALVWTDGVVFVDASPLPWEKWRLQVVIIICTQSTAMIIKNIAVLTIVLALQVQVGVLGAGDTPGIRQYQVECAPRIRGTWFVNAVEHWDYWVLCRDALGWASFGSRDCHIQGALSGQRCCKHQWMGWDFWYSFIFLCGALIEGENDVLFHWRFWLDI